MNENQLAFAIIIITTALIFDYTNGFHDAANSIATVVSTRVLSPRHAVAWAAFFNFVAFLFFGTKVAHTIGTGMIDISLVDSTVIFAGLLGTIAWNIVTWWFGIPTSSSHALIGGYAGAAIAKAVSKFNEAHAVTGYKLAELFRAGFQVIKPAGWNKTILFIVIAPTLGMILGLLLIALTSWIVYKRPPVSVNKWFRNLQLLSAALYSLGHGGNDAQKTMGIMTGALITAGFLKFEQGEFHVPLWVVLSAHGAIALGTLSGGWRIVHTMGQKITKLRPIEGFCAETASAISIYLATMLGIPVSTTHVITGAISGVGAARRLSAVKWGVTLKIVWAWILTIPMSAIFAFILYEIITHIQDVAHIIY